MSVQNEALELGHILLLLLKQVSGVASGYGANGLMVLAVLMLLVVAIMVVVLMVLLVVMVMVVMPLVLVIMILLMNMVLLLVMLLVCCCGIDGIGSDAVGIADNGCGGGSYGIVVGVAHGTVVANSDTDGGGDYSVVVSSNAAGVADVVGDYESEEMERKKRSFKLSIKQYK